MKYLLDTCVLSEMVAPNATPSVVRFVDGLDPAVTHLSVISIGEIQRGISRLPAAARRSRLESWLRTELLSRFEGQILTVDVATMITWGEITARVEIEGRRMPVMDSLIAASARTHDCVLITRNVADFEPAGIEIINPWASLN